MPGSQSIEGLISNLDISSIVDSIIEAEREPVNVMEQDKAFKTQQVAAYQAVLAKFLSLETSASLLKRETQFNRYNVSISDESLLTASTTGQVPEGTYSLRVESLARNHQLASQGFDDATTALFGTGTINIAVGDDGFTAITVDSANNTLIGIKDAINDANVGVTASIINDGSASNPFRLLLTSDETGAAQNIHLDVNLAGGANLDFENGSFDNPETVTFSSQSSSAVSLGASASFSGSKNKIYTFTVQDSGTIGTNNITINWSDGTNSGAILVTEADAEIDVLLDGAEFDGLKLAFTSGTLTAGDKFQVATFAPLLQEASDARIAIGGGGQGSPIIATSTTNTFKDVIPGLTLNVTNVSDPDNPEDRVTIKTALDASAIKDSVESFIGKYNDVMDFIESQFTYDTDSKESGVLFADYSLQIMQSSLRVAVTSRIKGLTGGINSLAAIGIRSDVNGKLRIADSAALTKAITENFEKFKDLFLNSGRSTNTGIEFVSAANETVAGSDYNVEITQAASKGYLQGKVISDPALSPLTLTSSNNKFQIRADGLLSSVLTLTERTYESGADLAEELQQRIDNDDTIGALGLAVEWVDNGETGYLKIISGTYGKNSKVEAVVDSTETSLYALGLSGGTLVFGTDVAGTINGEAATGNGQILTGNDDNATTAGLKLRINLTDSDLVSGVEGTISIIKGLGAMVEAAANNITRATDGTIARRSKAINSQITDLGDRIEDYEARLERRRDDLHSQFLAMEEALSKYQAEAQYLEAQIASLQNNYL